jgi:hypothetical protein
MFVLQNYYSQPNETYGVLTLPVFYTPKAAEEVLPEVKDIVHHVVAIKTEADIAKDDAEMARAMEKLEGEVKKLEELGCLLRDMSIGLVDFPAVRLGERVWLCWKLGEEHVKFWHTRHEGYGGRKPVEEKEFYDDDLAIRSLNREIVSKTHS